LTGICRSLTTVEAGASNWQALVTATERAIANPHNTYNAIAPLVIRELKQAGDLLAAHRDAEITVSANLQQAGIIAAPVAPLAQPAATAPAQITVPADVRCRSSDLAKLQSSASNRTSCLTSPRYLQL
jgi:hypothetical protein